MGYDAFISYSHDTDGDRAKAIEDGLERFAKPWHRRRSLNVFRDSSGLSANPGLWSSIAQVMEQSEWLVILCSPESANSPWVGREIEHWIATKPDGRLLPVLTAGELTWDQSAATFDFGRSTAAHPALAAAFTEEPLWVDMRFADNADARSLRDPRFQQAIADLAAPMHGVAKDELIGEDIRQHRRTLRFAWAAVIALLLLAVGTIAGAATAARNAQEAERLADEVLAANRSIDDLQAEQAAAQSELDATNAELASANDQLEEANAEVEQANAEADQANTEKTAAQGERDQANVDRDNAQAESVRFQGLADIAATDALAARTAEALAQGRESEAKLSEAAAISRQEDAELKQVEAEAAADDARRAEADALSAKDQADRDAAIAAAEAARQGDIARATQLATESGRAEVRGRHMDLSLLLATEAASIEPELAALRTAGFTAMGSNPPTVVPDAHGALLSAVTESTGLEGFLHFGCRIPLAPPCPVSPQKLGRVAVSPDGKYVAAVEDSQAIQNGEETARLFVWDNADDPERAQVHELSGALGCVSDLQWTQGSVLVTVEDPLGCLNPYEIAEDAQGIAYKGTFVQVWDPLTSAGSDLCGGFGISPMGRSPVAVSSDQRFLAVTCDLGRSDAQGPVAGTILLDGPSARDVAGLRMSFTATRALGFTFSPLGRYAHGWDWLADVNTVVDLHNWIPSSPECPEGCFASTPIQLPDADLFIGLEFAPPDASGVERLAVATVEDAASASAVPHAVAIFDVTTGAVQARIEVPSGVAGATLAIGGELLIVSDLSGTLQLHVWRVDRTSTLPLPSGLGACDEYIDLPTLSQGGTLILLQRLCIQGDSPKDIQREDSVLVVDRNTAEVLRELRGTLVHSSADDRYVVTQQLDQVQRGDSTLPRFGYELWDFGARTEALPTDEPDPGTLVSTDTDVRPLVSPDGRLLVAVPSSIVSDQDGATLWHLDEDGPRGPVLLPGSTGARSVAFVDDTTFVGVGRMGAAVLWRPDRTPYTTLYDDPTPLPCASGGSASSTDNLQRSAMSPDLRTRAASIDARTIGLIDVQHGTVEDVFALDLPADQRIQYLFFSPDGQTLVVNVERSIGTSCRFGPVTGSIVVPLGAPGRAVAFPGEQALAATGDVSRLLFATLDGGRVTVRSSADYAPLAEVDTSQLVPPSGPGPRNVYALDPAGTRVAGTNSTGRAVVWDVTTGQVVWDHRPDVQPTADVKLFGLRFSPTGSDLAVKSVDQKLRIYDADDGRVLHVLGLPTDAGARVFFSPDDRLIAVDGVYLFDRATLRPVGGKLWPSTWDDPSRDLGSQASRFVEGADHELYLLVERAFDTGAVLWRVDVAGLKHAACDLAGRNLTPDEFARYLPTEAYRETCAS